MKLNCAVIDDEKLARIGMIKYIGDVSFLNLTGDYSDPLLALDALKENVTDLVFLDIQMPKLTGIELLQALKKPPLVIVTTAYSNYALKGFELNVIDYLLKPVAFDRFLKAVNKVKDYFELQVKAAEGGTASADYFFVKCENRFEKIAFDELVFVEAQQNYVVLHTVKEKYISYLPFNRVEGFLPGNLFIKVNKSCILSKEKIDRIEEGKIIVGEHAFAVSRNRKDEIMSAIFNNRLLKR
jgi:two-component system LytT family response regulator